MPKWLLNKIVPRQFNSPGVLEVDNFKLELIPYLFKTANSPDVL